MVDLTVTQRLLMIAQTQGIDKATTELEKLEHANENVGRSALSVERALERQRKSLDDNYNAFKRFQSAQRDLVHARQQELVGVEEYNKLSALNKQRFEQATTAAGQFTTALNKGTGEVRLARHELINLSRQIQDVGVGIASGQSPFTILVQQGSQIADVFATSTGTLRGFFSQAVAGAGRFLGSVAGIATTVGTMGAAIVYAAASYSSGQKEIERALSGIGRASGVTRDQINQIGETSASAYGLSASEARTAATAFAATGKVYGQNVAAATSLVDAYARAGGDAAEVTKMLAGAMADPAAGALELNKQFGFLDATTLNLIRSLQSQGRQQDAIKTMLDAAAPSIQRAAEQTGFWAKAWNLASNSASEYFEVLGKGALRAVEGVTGMRTGGYSQQEDLDRAKKRLQEKRESPFQGALAQPGIKAAEEEVRRLEKAYLDLGLAQLKTRDAMKSLAADAAARMFMPITAEIEKATQALNTLIERRLDTGGPVTGAEKVGNVRLVQLEQEEAAIVRQAEATSRLALMYPGMTIETGKTLYNLQQQTTAAAAVGTAQQLSAQQQANINTMVAQGIPLQDATARAVAQTALAQAQINAQAQVQLVQAQQQLTVAQARTGAEKIVAQEAATVATLLAQQVDRATALQIAATQRAAAEANVKNEILNQIKGLEDQVRLADARANGTEASVKAEMAYRDAIKKGATEMEAGQIASLTKRVESIKEAEEEERKLAEAQRAQQQIIVANNQVVEAHNQLLDRTLQKVGEIEHHWANIPGIMVNIIDHLTDMEIIVSGLPQFPTWTNAAGQAVQFNPEGYQITTVDFTRQNEQSRKNAEKLLQDTFGGKGEIRENRLWGMNVEGGLLAGYTVVPSEEGYKFLREKPITEAIAALGQSDISTPAALEQTFKNFLGLGFSQAGLAPVNRLIDAVADPGTQANLIQRTIDEVMRTQPPSLAREEMINDLNAKLEQLTKSTDSLNSTMQNALSPFYSQDPRTTKLGFRAGVVGNPDWLAPGASNINPLAAILGPGAIEPGGVPGFANGGSFIVGGGYSANDNKLAVFPVASGEEVIVNRTPGQGSGGGNIINIDNRTIVMGSVDTDILAKLKVSKFQQSQRMRGQMAQV